MNLKEIKDEFGTQVKTVLVAYTFTVHKSVEVDISELNAAADEDGNLILEDYLDAHDWAFEIDDIDEIENCEIIDAE